MKHSAVVLIIVLILSSGFLFHTGASSVAAEDSVSYDTVYTSIVVQPGDSLWSISEHYMEHSNLSLSDYMEQIRTLNHLHEDTLYPGAHLVVPVSTPQL